MIAKSPLDDAGINQYGLYVHIPFCIKACRYCDFHSQGVKQGDIETMLGAICAEHRLVSAEGHFAGLKLRSIYIGGGTPSIIPANLWGQFVSDLLDDVDTSKLIEFTVECNPQSANAKKLNVYAESGVDRISIGVQSLDKRELAILGRPHNAESAIDILNSPELSLFKSVSADIMLGIPAQTKESLQQTIDEILSSKFVKHISAYELNIADNTPFGRHRKILPLPNEDELSELSTLLKEKLSEAGFVRYEVSNWALPGHESRHNSAYWTHVPYIGLGPSAHSFDGSNRHGNIVDNMRYVEAISSGKLPREFSECLIGRELMEETVMLGLRTSSGVKKSIVDELTGRNHAIVDSFIKAEFLIDDGEYLRPTNAGLDMADGMTKLICRQ